MTRRSHARRLATETSARARVLPEPTPRTVAPPARLSTPFRAIVDAYRQTPESWESVWADDKEAR